MGNKRRRERDRPKFPYDGAYDPNKRVLLSYASDEEDGPAEVMQEHEVSQSVIDNYQIEEYPDEEDEENNGLHLSASVKALRASDRSISTPRESVEGGRSADPTSLFGRGYRRNLATGQTPAIGALSFQWEDEEFDEDEDDLQAGEALAYLKAVRSERQALPSVFITSNAADIEKSNGDRNWDNRRYLADDAYVAPPAPGANFSRDMETSVDAQAAFTQSLLLRFREQRDLVRNPREQDMLAPLDDEHPTTFPFNNKKAYADWTHRMRTSVPLPRQLYVLSQSICLRLLELVQCHHLARGRDISRPVSIWIWSLLSRLDDVSTMDNNTVYVVRAFAKRAVLVQLSFSNSVAAEQLEHAENNGLGENDMTDSKDSDALKDQNPEVVPEQLGSGVDGLGASDQLSTSADFPIIARQNTLATLDTIILIVGELFGQRDLLEFRENWNMGTKKPDDPIGLV